MSQKLLNEISRYKVALTKTEDPFLTWDNSVLSVRTDKNLYVLKFTYNFHCLSKEIDWSVTNIPCPKTSPATGLFPKKIVHNLSNFDFTQMIVNTSLWPHNSRMMEEMACIVSVEWSPPLIHNEGIVAVMNNVGNVELFESCVCGYKSVHNISSLIEEWHKKNNSEPQNIEEVKAAVFAVETSAICWGGEHDGSILFITAQKNGDIHFWKLCSNENVKIEHITIQKSDSDCILMMKCIPLTSDTFLLIFSNELGQLFVNKYKWESDEIKLIKSNCLWTDKDKMLIKFLKYSIVDNRIILYCNKHRHLLVLMINDDANKISEYVNNINDYKVTAISERNNEFYVGTINCNVFKINTKISDDDLNVNVEQVTVKQTFLDKELHGIEFSKNGVMCALAIFDKKNAIKKENPSLDILFLSPESSHGEEIKCLINNPTKQLTDYWDCVEILRCKTLKLKTLPFIDYNQLYKESSNDIYKLKVYYILLILYTNLVITMKNNSQLLPETSIDVVREKIIMLHAKSILKRISKQCKKSDYLIDLEKESFVGAKHFVTYYCQKYNIDRSSLVSNGVWNALDVDYTYTCQCCDEKINGFTCNSGHLNMFCALTLTPIETENYMSCVGCGSLAKIDLKLENPLCLFCDLHLNNHLLSN